MTIMVLRRSACSLLAVLTAGLLTAVPASAQTRFDTSKFIVFIHAGGSKDDRAVRLISGALFAKGYTVRAPDADQDEVGGPAVDYFDDSAKDAAQDVATIVNDTFVKLEIKREEKQILKPRKQITKARTSPNWLGVWLF
jgi:hypothetical protein